MSEIVIAKYSDRELVLNFPTDPGARIRVKLNMFGFIASNTADTQYTFKDFELNHERGLYALDFLEKQTNYELAMTNSLKMFLNTLKTRSDIEGLARRGISIKENNNFEVIAPPRFKRELKDYQIMPVLHFKELNYVANFSVPGSGKTTIVLAGYDILKNEGKIDKLLVIGPYSSLMPWEEEIKDCFQDPIPKTIRIHGNIGYRQKICIVDEINSKYEIFLTTYETARRDIDLLIQLLQKYKFGVVLDESHNIKNIDGRRSNAILRLSPYCSAKIILTGTPVPNTIHDIYSQITFLFPGALLGDKDRFKYMIRSSNPIIVEDIKNQVYPFFTRISKNQMNLPNPIEINIRVEMSPVQKTLYKLVSERWLNIIEMSENLFHFDTLNSYKNCLFIRLRQIASNLNLLMEKSSEYNLESLKDEILGLSENPQTDDQILEVINNLESYSNYECSPKLIKTVELVEDLKEKKNVKKVLIWSEFIVNLETLFKFFKEEYGDNHVFLIIGDTPKSKAVDLRNGIYTKESREDVIAQFKKDPDEFSILVANPQACAESISLHKVCHDSIYVDRSYNCGQFMQSKDRIHRIGLSGDDVTTYYYLISTADDLPRGCIDEKIHLRLREKELEMLDILNDTESFIGLINDPDAEEFEIFYSDM